MTTATTEPMTLTAHPVQVAGGMRMMARHLLDTTDVTMTHPTRLMQTADEASRLIADAQRLVGEDQHDRELRRRIEAMREVVMTPAGPASLRPMGWDGVSQPIVEAVQPCGCRWTRDGKARLSVCTGCLTAASRGD